MTDDGRSYVTMLVMWHDDGAEMTYQTKALPNIGQEVLNLDLSTGIDPATAQGLIDLWKDAGVVLFRGLGHSPETLLNLSRCFGEPDPHPIETFRMKDYPELICLTNKGGLRGPVYAFDGVPTYGRIPWHTDLAFAEMPNAGALLNMVEKAEIGGRTAWLDTERAYAALDQDLKQRINGLEAKFEFCADLAKMKYHNPGGVRVGESSAKFPDYQPLARPLVWKHPDTGRTIMNICPLNLQGIIGMDEAESDALIQTLIDAVIKPQFIYEHAWENGDIILWDNYRMMHSAMGHPVDVVRVAHRATLRGKVKAGRMLSE